MTAAKAPRAPRKPRIRKPGKDIVPKPPADIVPRSPFTGWGAVDGLVWRARHAVELPVFWNPAGLDAADADRRATEEAACAALDASYDLNHYRALPDWGAFPGEDERWQWYRRGKHAAADAWNAWDTAMADGARDTADAEVAHEPHLSGPLPAGDWAIALPPVSLDLDPAAERHMRNFLTLTRQDGGFSEPDEEGVSWRVTPDVPGPVEDPPPPGPGTPGEAGGKSDG